MKIKLKVITEHKKVLIRQCYSKMKKQNKTKTKTKTKQKKIKSGKTDAIWLDSFKVNSGVK